jgi:hypothetical protein
MFMTEYCPFEWKCTTEHLSTAVNLQVRMSTGLLGTLLEEFCGFPQYENSLGTEKRNLH